MAWKKICCPVDFSWESRVAMEEAADLAWRFGGDLTLVHVDDRPAQPSTSETLAPPRALEQGTLELDRKLGTWRDEAESIATTTVDCALLVGSPSEEIARFAREGRYDVIVMGTHGKAGLEHWGLGSVAQAVVREAPCTVVVVRGRAARAPQRFAPAEGGGGPQDQG